jgi:hypothetical protein
VQQNIGVQKRFSIVLNRYPRDTILEILRLCGEKNKRENKRGIN